MDIPVLQDDEIENEFDIKLCCLSCAIENYKWSSAQFEYVKAQAEQGIQINIPSRIETATQFIEFVKNNIKPAV